MLKDFKNLISELQAENSSNGKKEILKKYPQCKELLRWTLDPYKKFGVTSDQLQKRKDLCFGHVSDGFLSLLNLLVKRDFSGHTAIQQINSFISQNIEYEDLIYRIIDKDLKCRTGATLINKVYPGLIPEFNVALAKDYFKEKNVDIDSGKWLWSRKLDGVRCLARVDNGNVKFFSREGHEFFTLDILKEEIQRLGAENTVIDGEICLVDADGKEDFQNVMKEIRKKGHTIKNPKYKVFDFLTLEEFDKGTSVDNLVTRLSGAYFSGESSMIEILDQHHIGDLLYMEKAFEYAQSQGWEGLILRKDVPYEGKRTKNMLKVKKMHDAEYKVTNVFIGDIDDGQGNKVKGMTAVSVQHKHTCTKTGIVHSNPVKVGSGWTYEQRIRFYEHPEDIVGKTITVKYFEETKNQDGYYSLRFPIMKAIHGEKREV